MSSTATDWHPPSADSPPYVIAEIGANHNGDMDLCRRLIAAAAAAGADAVKFQSWTDDSLISREEYERNTSYSDKKKHFGTLEEMVQEYQLSPEEHRQTQVYCREQGVTFCSTAFSEGEVDLLDDLGVPFFKTASMDINHLRLLRYIARKDRPMVVSTGMATLGEIARAVEAIRAAGNEQITLLHCVSLYPPDPDQINLRNMSMLAETFGVPVGLSDHSLGISVPLAAIGCGARVIEKHFTLDKDLPGWDHAVSADPDEMEALVEGGRKVRRALGQRQRVVSRAEVQKAKAFRRSAVLNVDKQPGDTVREQDLDFKRPGTGVRPDEVDYVIGRTFAEGVEAGHVLRWEHLGRAPASAEHESGSA